MNSSVIDAILAIDPNAQVNVSNNDIDRIEWLGDTSPISKSDIQKKIDALSYTYKRRDAYPSIADQLDNIYHNGIDAWKATIKATKDKYPKS
tara:strand:- start:41 stop:316 length:276 start_codon:yes stop_codon:yes gene_type:complete